jgi:hypothetical protein
MAFFVDGDLYPTAHPGSDDTIQPHTFHHRSSTSPPSSSARSGAGITGFPLYDPDSPFNSPIVPVTSLGPDGRLKTRLMGVGTDGGFLTSPMLFGGSTSSQGRSSASSTAGDIQIAGSTMDLNAASAAMGMGISGVGEVNGVVELGADYGNPNLRIYGMPKSVPRNRTASECGFLPYPDHLPTTTLGRGKNNVRDIIPVEVGSKFVEHRFPKSPSADKTTSTIGKRLVKKVVSSINTSRKLNKAKSCSALTGDEPIPHSSIPLTPTSTRTSTFPLPGVPYNSPIDVLAAQTTPSHPHVEPSIMPFSFADLYNFGLAVDSVEEIDPRKSPYAFANDLLIAENGGLGGYGDDAFGNLAHSLPTPYLAHGSGFSSPSTTSYLSDTSPELDMGMGMTMGMGLGMGYMSPGEMSSTSMLSAPSMMSVPSLDPYVVPLDALAPSMLNAGRQRCVTYNTRPGHGHSRSIASTGMTVPSAVNPALLSPPTRGHQRHASSPGMHHFIPDNPPPVPSIPPNFSYPARFVPPAPTSAWSTNLPLDLEITDDVNEYGIAIPSSPSYTLNPMPPLSAAVLNAMSPGSDVFSDMSERNIDDAFDDNLVDFDDIYQIYSRGNATPTKAKRARGGSDDEDQRSDLDDGSGEYVPGVLSPNVATPSTRKRLRTVASAPNLGTHSNHTTAAFPSSPIPIRRLRPGPRPKGQKSPQEAQMSVFQVMTSPPLPYHARGRRATSSPYLSDASPVLPQHGFGGSDDDFTASSHPGSMEEGDENEGVPKEVIQSLYSGLASHMSGGVKIPKRYVCLIEGCERTFPRKSAIESHIQTHLEDKPFVCPDHDWCVPITCISRWVLC